MAMARALPARRTERRRRPSAAANTRTRLPAEPDQGTSRNSRLLSTTRAIARPAEIAAKARVRGPAVSQVPRTAWRSRHGEGPIPIPDGDPRSAHRQRNGRRRGAVHLEPANTLADQVELEQIVTSCRRSERKLHGLRMARRGRIRERDAREIHREGTAVARAQVHAEIDAAHRRRSRKPAHAADVLHGGGSTN